MFTSIQKATCGLAMTILHAYTLFGQAAPAAKKSDTTFIHYSKEVLAIPKRSFRYDRILVLKLMLSQASFDGKFKRHDNGKSDVHLNFESTLGVIKKIDALTLGIPKIIYVTGWQYNGHDSKYPAWFEGNERLKRPQDTTALQSLRWLMKEAFKYHTTVSVHINMFDAYDDSPLWDTYVKNDIIAKQKDGSLLTGEWGYPISYAREWELGYTRKRIDSLCALLPLVKAGTVHIDAFHTYPPLPVKDEKGVYHIDLSPKVISPYLHYSIEDEMHAQERVFKYWESKGIDVTSEGVNFLRPTSFAGLQPMAWWFSDGLDSYLRWPASYYCGGTDRTEWGKLFGSSMHGEDIVLADSAGLKGWKEKFCNSTLIWMFLNTLERRFVVQHNEIKSVHFSSNVVTTLQHDTLTLTQAGDTLVEGSNLLVPAVWIKKAGSLLAYSRNGYTDKKWQLPAGYKHWKQATVYEITQEGKQRLRTLPVKKGVLVLSLEADQLLLLQQQ